MTQPRDLVTVRPAAADVVEVLSREECLALLAQSGIARLAWVDGDRARIVPVAIAVADGAIVFWSGPGRKVDAALAGQLFTLEVERLEPALHLGWSIEVLGSASVDDAPETVEQVLRSELRPWIGMDEPRLICVAMEEITGRRLPERAATATFL